MLCMALCTVMTFAQEKASEPESKSKAVEFMASSGTCLKKEFYDLESVKTTYMLVTSTLKCQVLVMTNIVSGGKMGCLRLQTEDKYSTYIGTLDYDEIEACIQSLTYINETLLPSKPDVYTECEYKTKDGVKFGAYYGSNEWKAYVYTKGYTSKSAIFCKKENIETIISILSTAKDMIAEKVK